MLVGPLEQKIVLMSQVEQGEWAGTANLTFDAYSQNSLLQNLPLGADPIPSGVYAPTCYNPSSSS